MEQVRKESKTLRPFFVKNDDIYIANDLHDEILKLIHTVNQMKTLLTILRNPEPASVNAPWIAKKTKMHVAQVYRSIHELAQMRVVNVRRYNGNRMYVSLNANHQEWLCPPPSPRGRNKKAAIKGGR